MLFNSLEFIAFLAAVLLAYHTLRGRLAQNRMLLVASYIFYGWWDWRFLALIALSTVVDFFIARGMKRSESDTHRKHLMWASASLNLGLLGVFKYFNFFADSTVAAFNAIGLHADAVTLQIVLPVGISFYTFQTLSYTIDVYRKRLEPTDDFLDFALFVSFFPQLVAGPIERASALLPQIALPRRVDWAQINAGVYLIVWGLFKKVVVADRAAIYSDRVFNDYQNYTGADLVLAVVAFTVQIYGDFSGYSDIARGVAKLLGFELMVNFKLPFFAHNPSDYWRRWHVSLSSWLRDYLYISLGGNRNGALLTYRNLFLTMLLGGLWHGAAWNYVFWGAFHGAILLIYRATPVLRDEPSGAGLRGWLSWAWRVVVMFTLTLIGFVIFRCTDLSALAWWFTHVGPQTSPATLSMAAGLALYTLPLLLIQVWQLVTGDLLIIARTRLPFRVLLLTVMILGICILGERESAEFIYFQF